MDIKPYKIPHPFRKLNKELIDVIVKDMEEGSTHKLAAESNGITARILQLWRKQGEVDVEHELDTLPAYLVRSLSKIKQIEVKKCRQTIVNNEKGHKGAEWTLEHAYWREFGNNENIVQLAEEMEEFKEKKLREENLKGVDEDGEELDCSSD